MASVNDKLRALPSIDELLRKDWAAALTEMYGPDLLKETLRVVIDNLRSNILDGVDTGPDYYDSIQNEVVLTIEKSMASTIKKVVNATGTILHTNLGRSLLCDDALEAINVAGANNINLEYDIEREGRGLRDSHVEKLITKLTGAEAALVVNNNAAAVLLALNSLAEGKEVVVSRGEQVEIGGSFRLPDIINKSGCKLVEVGTTNRTHLKDYEEAVTDDTAVFLKAHTSNYHVVGFTKEVSLSDLSGAARKAGIALVEDLGSGLLVDLTPFGIKGEPLVKDSIAAGVDVVTFSGDKLLGGPQAGIVAGKKYFIDKLNKSPLKRALRVDKLTLSALEATLKLYSNPDTLTSKLPSLKYISRSPEDIKAVADDAKTGLEKSLGDDFSVAVVESFAQVGSGSLPGQELKSYALEISSSKMSASKIFSKFLKEGSFCVLGRVHDDKFYLDLRAVDSADGVNPFK